MLQGIYGKCDSGNGPGPTVWSIENDRLEHAGKSTRDPAFHFDRAHVASDPVVGHRQVRVPMAEDAEDNDDPSSAATFKRMTQAVDNQLTCGQHKGASLISRK